MFFVKGKQFINGLSNDEYNQIVNYIHQQYSPHAIVSLADYVELECGDYKKDSQVKSNIIKLNTLLNMSNAAYFLYTFHYILH